LSASSPRGGDSSCFFKMGKEKESPRLRIRAQFVGESKGKGKSTSFRKKKNDTYKIHGGTEREGLAENLKQRK